MSETVNYVGKIKEVERPEGINLEEQCKYLLGNPETTDYYDSYAEMLYESEKYIVVKDRVFEILEKENKEDQDTFKMNKNPDGTYDFQLRYYNGACSLNEAMEIAYDDMGKKHIDLLATYPELAKEYNHEESQSRSYIITEDKLTVLKAQAEELKALKVRQSWIDSPDFMGR